VIYIMKMLHKIYIYHDHDTLPEEGWFQSCFLCYTITSHTHLFDTREIDKKIYEINVYLCPDCKKKMQPEGDTADVLKQKCTIYINKHFFTYP
jgi:hypothetical protein